MNEEFLLSLGLDKELSDKILEQYTAERLDNAIEKALSSAEVCDRAAAELLLRKDGLSLENLSEKVAVLKSEHPALFKSAVPKIISSAEPVGNIKKNDFEKMGYKERLALFKKSPDIYKKLVQ